MRSGEIVDRLYADVPRKKERRKGLRVPRLRLRRFSFKAWLWKVRGAIVPVGIVVVYLTMHLYYYNRLISLQYDVDAAWSQIEAQLLRRHHIQQNLTKISMDYAGHEREVLVALTELRAASSDRGASMTTALPDTSSAPVVTEGGEAGGPAAAGSDEPVSASARRGPDPFGSSFSKLQLVAEQYPQLMLSKNLEQFARAVIQTENEIAARTMAYNDAVNQYSTLMGTFPANIFAKVCGFETRDFYRPDQESMRFRRVEY